MLVALGGASVGRHRAVEAVAEVVDAHEPRVVAAPCGRQREAGGRVLGCSVATALTTKPIFMRPLRSARRATAPPARAASRSRARRIVEVARPQQRVAELARVGAGRRRAARPTAASCRASSTSRSPPRPRWSTSSRRPRRYTASLVRPPDRNTRTVIVNAWWWGMPSLDEAGVDLLEGRAAPPSGARPRPGRRAGAAASA